MSSHGNVGKSPTRSIAEREKDGLVIRCVGARVDDDPLDARSDILGHEDEVAAMDEKPDELLDTLVGFLARERGSSQLVSRAASPR